MRRFRDITEHPDLQTILYFILIFLYYITGIAIVILYRFTVIDADALGFHLTSPLWCWGRYNPLKLGRYPLELDCIATEELNFYVTRSAEVFDM